MASLSLLPTSFLPSVLSVDTWYLKWGQPIGKDFYWSPLSTRLESGLRPLDKAVAQAVMGAPKWAQVATSVSAAVCPAEAQRGETRSLLCYRDVRVRYGEKPGSPLAVNREVAVLSCVSETRIYVAWVGQWRWLETWPAWGGGGKIQG